VALGVQLHLLFSLAWFEIALGKEKKEEKLIRKRVKNKGCTCKCAPHSQLLKLY